MLSCIVMFGALLLAGNSGACEPSTDALCWLCDICEVSAGQGWPLKPWRRHGDLLRAGKSAQQWHACELRSSNDISRQTACNAHKSLCTTR
jgi:hypothetical protein